MLHGEYVFSSELEDAAVLPYYKGSTFRGVFGHALKKVVCALKRQDCPECLLQKKCVYSVVFEPHPPEQEANGRTRLASVPHPYVIEPPDTTKNRFLKGEPFDVTLHLFGRANEYLPYFIYAFDRIGNMGIGRPINGARARFRLIGVRVNNETVYSSEDGKIRKGEFTKNMSLEDFAAPEDRVVRRVELCLKTPLRLKFQNRLEATLPFHILVRAMLRRISSLCRYHGEGEPDLDYRGLVRRAGSVEVAHSTLRWLDWKRYSTRQEQSMLMGGMTGSVTYEGGLSEFLPLIRFCEKVHVGKQTTFGLGKIELSGENSR